MLDRAPKILLAKQPQNIGEPQSPETLTGHTCAVIQAAEAILKNLSTTIGLIFGLSEDDMGFLKNSLLCAALLHDLGKASSQFQEVVRGKKRGGQQALRHEWISAWLPLCNKDFASWLFRGDDTLQDVVLCAVLGHHLKAEDGASIAVRNGSGDTQLRCYWGHPDFVTCLQKAGTQIGLSDEAPTLDNMEIDLTERPLAELREWLLGKPGKTEIVPIVKALLMAADIAGSALPAKGELGIGDWIANTLGRRCSKDDIRNIVEQRLQGHNPRKFQCQVKNVSHRVTLVRAGCGSGKTAAAYMWAAERAKGRKLFICYPTTGTATEGYRDYIIPSEMQEDSALLHSRSEVDIESILEAEPDIAPNDAGLGIAALASWDVPVTICTADKVLGIIQNSRFSLYSSPAFMNAAFVFDEIHQYDNRLWGALLRFLKAFRGAPILLMTASLPRHRLEALRNILDGQLAVVDGPHELETLERYKLRLSKKFPWQRMEKALKQGGKVLWVCNTVSRCMEMGEEASKRFGGERVFPYHSRFRYMDRLEHHNKLIHAFRTNGPVLAVTTQVCEVSLDISADLLVTELAPVPALIQRLGRLNRRASPETSTPPCDAIFVEPSSAAPYDGNDLEDARLWLRRLEGKPVSQQALVREFEAIVDKREEEYTVRSEWLDGGKFSGQAPLREAGYTIPVIREEDVKQGDGPLTSRFVVRHEIPMLLGEVAGEMGGWRRIRHVWVAPLGRIHYDEKWGAKWAKR